MYIAMNRFSIAPGREEEFIGVWAKRDSNLEGVPGFRSFHLIKGESFDTHTVIATHTMWDSEEDFQNWTKSENFKASHKNAGSTDGMHVDRPKFEGWLAVV